MTKFFYGLGAVWVLVAAYQLLALRGDPDQGGTILLFAGMGLLNLAVGWYLDWRRDRRAQTRR